jgi:hypothetical protein
MKKLTILLQEAPKHPVILDSWLKKHNISNSLKQKYLQYGWLKSIGRGASYLANDKPDWQGAIVAIQEHGESIYIGGKSSLLLQGMGHFISLRLTKLYLFGKSGQRLPSWLLKYNWGLAINYHQISFLPINLGINTIKQENSSFLQMSSPERAVLELLYLVPQEQSIEEAYYIIENLNSLNHQLLQELLVACCSIKVKRLLFCLSERAGHDWVKKLNKNKLNFGSGKRLIVNDGYVDPIYHITLPKNWQDDDETPVF